jgi:hypothetical protein
MLGVRLGGAQISCWLAPSAIHASSAGGVATPRRNTKACPMRDRLRQVNDLVDRLVVPDESMDRTAIGVARFCEVSKRNIRVAEPFAARSACPTQGW